jgi:hypothetical protein
LGSHAKRQLAGDWRHLNARISDLSGEIETLAKKFGGLVGIA